MTHNSQEKSLVPHLDVTSKPAQKNIAKKWYETNPTRKHEGSRCVDYNLELQTILMDVCFLPTIVHS